MIWINSVDDSFFVKLDHEFLVFLLGPTPKYSKIKVIRLTVYFILIVNVIVRESVVGT